MLKWTILCIFVCLAAGCVLHCEKQNVTKGKQLYIQGLAACMIVCFVLGMSGTTYYAGQYAARQYEEKVGLTKRQYRANRWDCRAVLSGLILIGGGTGAVAALAIDDYYMGVVGTADSIQ